MVHGPALPFNPEPCLLNDPQACLVKGGSPYSSGWSQQAARYLHSITASLTLVHGDALLQTGRRRDPLSYRGWNKEAGPSAGQTLLSLFDLGLLEPRGNLQLAGLFSLLSLQDGVMAPNVTFLLISKLLVKTLRCVIFVIVIGPEVEIKASWQVGSEGRKDGLFENVIQHTTTEEMA